MIRAIRAIRNAFIRPPRHLEYEYDHEYDKEYEYEYETHHSYSHSYW